MVQPQSPESQRQQNNTLWWITDYSNMDTCKEAVGHRNSRSTELVQCQGGHLRLELKKGQNTSKELQANQAKSEYSA